MLPTQIRTLWTVLVLAAVLPYAVAGNSKCTTRLAMTCQHCAVYILLLVALLCCFIWLQTFPSDTVEYSRASSSLEVPEC